MFREQEASSSKIRLARRGPRGRGRRARAPRRRSDARSRRRGSGGPGSPRRGPRPRRDSPSRRARARCCSKIVPRLGSRAVEASSSSRTGARGTSLCRVRGAKAELQLEDPARFAAWADLRRKHTPILTRLKRRLLDPSSDLFSKSFDAPARTREPQTLNLIIPINFPVVVVIALLLPERHRLVLVVLLVLLDGSLVVLRRRQRGHPPRIHQPLLAVHAC